MADNMKSRARTALPSVILTLLSIIQAIALSEFWGQAVSQLPMIEFSLRGVVSGLQVFATFFLIIIIWLMYVEGVIRLVWTPDIIDLIAPFLIGLLQLAVILNMEIEQIAPWFYFLGAIVAGMYALEHRMAVRARLDDANQDFFSQISKATWIDHAIPMACALLFVAAGAWFANTGEVTQITLVSMVATILVWLYAFYKLFRFWKLAMA